MSRRDQLLDNINAFLEYKKEEGFQTLEISPETRAKLKPVATQKPEPAPKPAAAKPAAGTPALRGAPTAGSDVRVTGKTLAEIAKQISTCSACGLHASRNKTVPGEGNPNSPDILFIGEGPGADEDAQGRPFAGEPGQLLTKMIGAMGYTREQVFITNIVKCRAPGNRVPLPEEISVCSAYLRAQIALIKPKIIVVLGKHAIEALLNKPVAITRFRGTWCTYEGIDLMPTFHPGYLLKSPGKKRETWADMQAVLAKLGKTPPKAG
ncbi:MAG: uracil-DNA glycosylase [Kiritimatiellales bacterium]|nr:uracil-DNA glycosylase [Kiritimatiellota bacterium]MBL7012027.1 uracil-DNA glycosylase [Kiritimatiellales bacterium]